MPSKPTTFSRERKISSTAWRCEAFSSEWRSSVAMRTCGETSSGSLCLVDCLLASRQRSPAPSAPSPRLCTVCRRQRARLHGTPRPRCGARTPAGSGHTWLLPCRARAQFQVSRGGPHSRSLEDVIARPGHGPLRLHLRVLHPILPVFARLSDHAVRLMPILGGQLTVPL